MKKGRIYLQYGFWKTVKKTASDVFGPNAWDLYCVLQKNHLFAEIPIELFDQDAMLKELWHSSGGSCYIDDGQIEELLGRDNLSIEDLCSIFLVDRDDNFCKKYEQKNGVLCLNADLLVKQSHLISEKNLPFDFHEEGNFYKIQEYFCHSCNSLILIDPHILKESYYINHHIKHLLTNILPQSLEIPFHISIFCGIGKTNESAQGKSFYDEIHTMLEMIRPHLNFSLTLYQIPIQGEGWHARYVITNNLIIQATEGFDVFGRVEGKIKAKKTGKFIVTCPLLKKTLPKNEKEDDDSIKEYSIWINKTAKESMDGKGYHHERWGTRENRLFELVKD